mgnify:CR=1 FL=1
MYYRSVPNEQIVYISCSFVSNQDQKNLDIKAVVRNNSLKNFIFLKNKSYYLLDKKVRYSQFNNITIKNI